MVHVILDVNKISFHDYYQQGEGVDVYKGKPPYQRGYGVITRRQRGDGLGRVIRRVWNILLPLLKTAGKAVGQEGIATAGRMFSNIAEGQPAKETVVNESYTGMKNLLDRAKESVNETLGAKAKENLVQSGSGMRKRKRKRRVIRKNNSLIGGFVHPEALFKKGRRDAFGLY